MKDLQQLFQEITSGWRSARSEPFTNHPLASLFRNDLVAAVQSIVSEVSTNCKVKGSVGAGNWANVPWLSILDLDITNTTQDGIYPVYLFKADGSGVYLSFNQGTTAPAKRLGKKAAQKAAQEWSATIRDKMPGLASWGVSDIDLAASTSLGKSYESPNVVAKYYPANAIPDSAVLKSDLVQMLKSYREARPIWFSFCENGLDTPMKAVDSKLCLSKPFLLLAGISGTGKTRFVRRQAEYAGGLEDTYCLVSVRPDWHEPSDLLGYVSRLGPNGPRYVVSDILRFMVSAWKEIMQAIDIDDGEPDWVGRDLDKIRSFWLCLDEMNLAPVEQYFADFLSVLETRRFLNEGELQTYNAEYGVEYRYVYTCDPILKPSVIEQLDSEGRSALRRDLGLAGEEFDGHWAYFNRKGIALPFNLMVAGTVNMDETTHGFSRKVIDRALTIDFGEFFPNDYAEFFDPQTRPVSLSYPVISSISRDDLSVVAADPDGERTVKFLSGVNGILEGSSFELAYRALNELLISVVCFAPKDEASLYAVWDDFLMMKVLPRIEGDQEKLSAFAAGDSDAGNVQDLLTGLSDHLEKAMAPIWSAGRPELLRESVNDGEMLQVQCRSKAKIGWMRHRLISHGFTSFWP